MKEPDWREKKSESLDVRLPHSKKAAFMAACEEEGITASHAIRTFIDAYLARSRHVKVQRIAKEIANMLIRNPLKTTGLAGASLAALVMLSAQPSMADTDAFGHLDKTGDGILTVADFSGMEGDPDIATTLIGRLDKDADGKVSREEFDSGDARVIHREIEVTQTDGEEPKRREMIMIQSGDGDGLAPGELEALAEGEPGSWITQSEDGKRIEFRHIEKREETLENGK